MMLIMEFKRQILREIRLCRHELSHTFNVLLFFVMVVVFFPLTMPADLKLIQMASPGILWISILFAVLLMSEKLFYEDISAGVVEQWQISGYPLTLFIYAKLMVQGGCLLIPIVIFSPLFVYLFSISWSSLWILDLGFILGLPALLALAAFASVFTQGLSQKGLLMAVILLPLTLPILILGSGILTLEQEGVDIGGYLAILGGISVLAFGLLPFAIAGVLKVQN